MQKLLTNPTLTFEFQTSILKLLIFNYVIVLLIANQNDCWNFRFKDNRLGHELVEPTVLAKFGFCFRLLTIIINTLAIGTLLEPKRGKRNLLLPCVCWNFYTITAVSENLLEIIWSMMRLEVPFNQFVTFFTVGIFTMTFQTKLTLQVIRFYEYLNYVYT